MRIPHFRWYVAALIFASTVINYIDRQTLSVVAPVLTKELNIGPVAYGNILQAFLLAYTIMYVGSGILVDRWGTRISMAAFVVWWSIANALHMLVGSATQLAVCRFLLGIGEPGNYNAAGRVASEWYPARERAFINGLVNAGSAVGAIIATPLVVAIMARWGWRAAFMITGAFGFVWVVLWLLTYTVPEKSRFVTAGELAHIRSSDKPTTPAENTAWGRLWGQRDVWGLLLARFFSDPVWWFYLFWMPKYLVDYRGFTMQQLAIFAWLPYLTSDLGAIAGGWMSGRLINANRSPVRARYAVMLPAALFMPASAIIGVVDSAAVALAVICAITFCHQVWKTALMTITNDIYPVASVGSVSGIVSLGSGLGGVLFMNLTGRMVESFSYTTIFIIMGFLHPAAYLLCRLLVRPSAVSNREVVT